LNEKLYSWKVGQLLKTETPLDLIKVHAMNYIQCWVPHDLWQSSDLDDKESSRKLHHPALTFPLFLE
jgi:hypothetical protein